MDPFCLKVWDGGRRGTVNVELCHHGTAEVAGSQFGVSDKRRLPVSKSLNLICSWNK